MDAEMKKKLIMAGVVILIGAAIIIIRHIIWP
jgi:hypothetical protein